MALVRLQAPILALSTGTFRPSTTATNVTINAAGESHSCVGVARVPGGGSKTISAAGGGRIMWRSGSPITFADAGTTIRVGIQDVNASGVEDGTFDVYADYVGGTDTIAANTFYRKQMTSGSKTISDGDTISISVEMTARGGADSVVVSAIQSTIDTDGSLFPYRTTDSGSGPAKTASAGSAALGAIEFDDGTVGYIDNGRLFPITSSTTQAFGSSSTPDEYAVCFKVPFFCKATDIFIGVGSVGAIDTYEFIIYSDPFGSPTVLQSSTQDPDYVGSGGSGFYQFKHTEQLFRPGTWYAAALRPTSTNQISIEYYNMGSGFSHYKSCLPFGEDIKLAGRSDQTGAFVETQTYHLPKFGLNITHLDDGKYVYPSGQIGMN